MCGIAGIIDSHRPAEDLTLCVQRMIATLEHRGPDDHGAYADEGVALGHRRLSIIDTSSAGRQPMTNEDGTMYITYNGEIYNFKELKKELLTQGHVFRSHTDTEVLLHLYEQYGTDCLAKINGMFAFAIYNKRSNKLFAARDRLGIKPFFFHRHGNGIVFASEIKAILAANLYQPAINNEALYHYLSLNYPPVPLTLFNEIEQLLPAHYLIYSNKGLTTERYWHIDIKEQPSRPLSQIEEELSALIADATRIRQVSDVALGAFLSGGLDSSTIVSYMADATSDKTRTFSIGFAEKSYSELSHARRVSEYLKTNHSDQIVSPDLIDVLNRIVWHSEEPTADASMLPVYYLSQLTRNHVTVALSGDGADELFAGYETYQADMFAALYQKLPAFLRTYGIEKAVELLPLSSAKDNWKDRLIRFAHGCRHDKEKCHVFWRSIFSEEEKQKLLLPELIHEGFNTPDYLFKRFPAHAAGRLNRALLYDAENYLPSDMLVKVDRMSMAHSLEVRVPFLDHRIVEYAFSIAEKYKLHRYISGKYILKKIAEKRLPRQNVYRRKAGFSIPVDAWFRGPLKDFSNDIITKSNLDAIGIFNNKSVSAILSRHAKRKENNGYKIWCLLIVLLWHKRFFR